MSNTSKGWGSKGSKFWMQMVASFPKLEKEFIRLLENQEGRKIGEFEWISPKPANELEEYSLNSSNIMDTFSFEKNFWGNWPGTKESFWPRRQPQWDGIAVEKENDKIKTLYIIEAKAYPEEMHTSCSASDDSKKTIKKSLVYTKDKYKSNKPEETWWNGYYQLGNRLTFLEFLREKKQTNEICFDVKLVLLNFLNDNTHGMTQGKLKKNSKLDIKEKKTVEKIWEEEYADAWKKLIGTETAPADVLVINYDVEGPAFSDLKFIYDKDTDAKSSTLVKHFKYKIGNNGVPKESCFVIDKGNKKVNCFTDESTVTKNGEIETIFEIV